MNGVTFDSMRSNPDIIVWSPDYFLKWEDFQGQPPTSNRFGAQSECHVHHQWDKTIVLRSTRTKYQISKIIVAAIFVRSKSWVTKNQLASPQQAAILKHEQGHFDSFQIYASKLRDRLHEFADGKLFSCEGSTQTEQMTFAAKDSQTNLDRIGKQLLKELDDFSNKYENETSHGINSKKQADYDKYFDSNRRRS